MLGLKLFIHSIKLIFGNLQHALKISSPLLAIWVFGGLVMIYLGPFNGVIVDDYTEAFLFGGAFVVAVGLGTVWTAVNWHRFILLSEYPTGLMPKFPTSVFAYFWRGFLISVALIVAMLFGSSLVGFIGYAVGNLWVSAALLLAVGALVNWSFYLISPILPATAVDRKMSLSDAWSHTEDFAGSIFIASVAMSASYWVLEHLILWFSVGLSYWVSMACQSVFGWMYLMISISILTTIYGVAVEDRDL